MVYWQGKPFDVVDRFRYLGVELDTYFSLTHAAVSVRGRMFAAVRKVNTLASEQGVRGNPLAMLHLYRNFVLPHAMYGCQVWGVDFLDHLQVTTNPVQQTYTSFFRHLLGVRGSVAHNMILHEVAQPPLQFYWLRSACRFFNSIRKADSDLLTSVLRSDMELAFGIGSQHGKGEWRESWTHQLHQAITDLVPETAESSSAWRQLQYLELSHINISEVMHAWASRWQARWAEFDVDPRDEGAVNRQQSTYARWFKEGEGMKWRDVLAYMSDSFHPHTWRTMARFRLGNHGLGVEVGRHAGLPYSRRFCQRCLTWGFPAVVDDEHHIVFECITSLAARSYHAYMGDLEMSRNDLRLFMQTASALSFVRDVFHLLKHTEL
jgi:hypothetical protein